MRRRIVEAGAWVGLGLAVAALAALLAIPQARSDREASLAAWARVATVVQHPRCHNCHQPDTPLQGDSRRPHSPRVVRGRDNQGAPGMRCGSCHGTTGNNEASRVPGAVDWKMPPRSLAWGGLSIAQVCRTIRDPRKNGGRTPRALLKHVQDDSLIHWSWEPGGLRESVSMPHHVFVEFVDEWLQTGAHCPD